MHIVILLLLLVALAAGPGLWVRRVMQRYSAPTDRYGHSGEETARRLLDELGMEHVKVEMTEAGDHYDPIEKVVRLSPKNHAEKSLTAVTVAAHEVGHAIQDATRYGPLMMRTRLVKFVGPIEKVGAGLMMAIPMIIVITRVPYAGALMFLGGLMTLGSAVVIHMLTLPTEFDASFNRALPLLDKLDVLYDGDKGHAKTLLRAAAMTYVAASLMSLLNIARWWAILRR